MLDCVSESLIEVVAIVCRGIPAVDVEGRAKEAATPSLRRAHSWREWADGDGVPSHPSLHRASSIHAHATAAPPSAHARHGQRCDGLQRCNSFVLQLQMCDRAATSRLCVTQLSHFEGLESIAVV